MESISRFIDSSFQKNLDLLEWHNKNCFKGYVHDLFYPVEKNECYKEGNIYSIRIRTIDKTMATHFYEQLANHYDERIKGLTASIRILPKKQMEKIYSITPCLVKGTKYWREELSLMEYEERLKINLIKKYNQFTGEKVKEDFPFYTLLEFKNRMPIAVPYKGIKLLGDKVTLYIADDSLSQEMAYFALGTGLFENNARGFGFVNYRWY